MNFDLYTRLYLWLAARRPLVLFITLLIVIGSLVISSRIRLEEDILDTLPKKDRRVDEYRYSLRKFRQIDRVFIDVGVSSDDPGTLARAADEVFFRALHQRRLHEDHVPFRLKRTGEGD